VRKILTSYATVYENSARGGAATACFKGDHGRTFVLNNGGTDTRLFRKFIAGLERRMGRVVRQNSGIAIDILLKVFENYERELSQSSLTKERRREIIMAGAGFACLFCAALSGGELFLVEASELCRRIREGKSHPKHPFVIVPLM